MRCVSYSLIYTALLLAPMALGSKAPSKSMLEVEKPAINKIAQFTAREHSAILFDIPYVADIGYAKDGVVEWVNTGHKPAHVECDWPHPALSHDGLRVAFVSDGDTPKRCRIVIHDIATGAERELVETVGDPGEISWSWDDAEIAFFERGISTVSVRDAAKTILLPFPLKGKIGGLEFTYFEGAMQWLRNGRDLVVELHTEIPTKEPGTYDQQSDLLLVSGGDAHLIDIGSHPAVSPISDRIAYDGPKGITTINADGTEKTVLAKAPVVLFFGGRDDSFGAGTIVWSPDARRLFFGEIVSENGKDNLYLLDVKSGRRDHFLSHTSIQIRGWH